METNRYYVISCHVLWRELCYYASQSPNIYNFHFLKQGLHNTPEILRNELQKAIDQVPAEYSTILIGYGLCSNGLEGIRARGNKLVIMRGHDCITFLLGSKEKYQEYFDSHPGTYWYSPGWIETGYVPSEENLEMRKKEYESRYGKDNCKFLMEQEYEGLKNYTNAVYVELGVTPSAKYQSYTQSCAKWFGWKYELLQGNPQLMIDFLNGPWDSQRFLLVEPGQQIISSYDDKIIESVKEK